jgi:hypothetical protein
MSHFFSPAGGVVYHLRALKYSSRLWQPFRLQLETWLQGWNPPEKRLVLIGPSAGYSLNRAWLSRFDEIICLDPDRLAKTLFIARLRPHKLIWSLENYLELKTPKEQMQGFGKFIESYSDSAVLFSNFLGQLHLMTDTWPWKTGVTQILNGHSWASYHDRVSGPLPPKFTPPYRSTARLSDALIIEKLYSTPPEDVELIDHDTDGFFPKAREHTYLTWQLRPHWYHLIEAVHS